LALRIAVQNKDVRWAALLVWAGADPFRLAPDSLESTFPMNPDEDYWSTAANDAMWRADEQLVKALHLKPTPEQAAELLHSAAYTRDLCRMKELLAAIPREKINHAERNSCRALEVLIKYCPRDNFFGRVPEEKATADNLQAIELLLNAGARWNPDPKEIGYARRWIMRNDSRYLVQVFRLLLYTPNGADIPAVLELCRSPKVMEKITVADVALVSEIKELRKVHRLNTSSSSHNAANTDPVSAPLAHAD
jgi:hypothetical protein